MFHFCHTLKKGTVARAPTELLECLSVAGPGQTRLAGQEDASTVRSASNFCSLDEHVCGKNPIDGHSQSMVSNVIRSSISSVAYISTL